MKLNCDDRKKRRKKNRVRPGKNGLCPRFPGAKVKYSCRAVAEFDRNMLSSAQKEFVYVAFKCDRGNPGCGHWHVGRLKENGEYILAEEENE